MTIWSSNGLLNFVMQISEDSELKSHNIILTFVPVLIPVHFPIGWDNMVFSFQLSGT